MKNLKKLVAVLALVAFISGTMSSCHRDGCPNHITNIEQKDERPS